MADIAFLSKGISFRFSGVNKASIWLQRIAKSEKRKIVSLTYIFCSDSYLSKLNETYLKQSTLTDILTFDYSEGGPIEAEIFISIPRVRENAKTYSQTFPKELRRVMVHGLLHILGHQDKSTAERAAMRAKEEACLSLWS